MFEERVMNLRVSLEKSGFSEDLKSSADESLKLIRDAEQLAVRYAGDQVPTFKGHSDGLLSSFSSVVQSDDPVSVLQWAKKAAAEVGNFVESGHWVWGNDPAPADLGERARSAEQLAAMHLDNETMRKLIDNAVESAESAAEKAKDAAGVSGSASLATHFERYAKDELKAANFYRVLTVVGILVALAAATVLNAEEDWLGVVHRLTILAGLGALATYFARQAAQHRRIFNWARSLEVQLRSFPAFIEPVERSDQASIYRSFAQRVMGSPPDRGSSKPDEPLPNAQLVELLNLLIKRSEG